MTIKQLLFSFKGRISRKLYWKGVAISLLFFIVPIIMFGVFGAADILIAINEEEALPSWLAIMDSDAARAIGTIIILPFMIAHFWASFAVTSKRLHDLGLHGIFSLYWVALMFTGILAPVAFLIFIIIGAINGQEKPNKYGEQAF